jgi:hypothetical protein
VPGFNTLYRQTEREREREREEKIGRNKIKSKILFRELMELLSGSEMICKNTLKLLSRHGARGQWLMPVILATQEGEIRRIVVQSQPRQLDQKTLSQKILQKNRAGGMVQVECSELKPQY